MAQVSIRVTGNQPVAVAAEGASSDTASPALGTNEVRIIYDDAILSVDLAEKLRAAARAIGGGVTVAIRTA